MAVRLSKAQAAAMGFKTKAAPRKRGMNKTEQAYAEHLEALKRYEAIKDYWFECVKFRIGTNCFLTVDFMVLSINRKTGFKEIQFHDTKARWSNGRYAQDDAIVKMRAAADKYPFKFIAAIRERDGSWSYKEF